MIGFNELPEDTVAVIERSFLLKVFGYTFFVLGRISVPMLLILLGFEVLPGNYGTREKRFGYYKKIFLPAFVTWQIWVIVYLMFLHYWSGRALSVAGWLKQAFLIEYVDLSHAWVFRFVMLFLLIAPYVAMFLQLFSVGMLRFLMIIGWVFVFLFPGLDLYGQANGGEMSFPQSFGTFCYFYYFCLGFFVSRYVQRIFKGSKEVVFFGLSFVLTVWSQFSLDSRGVDYLIKPTYFGVSLMALFGFDLLVRVKVDDMYPRVSAFFKEAYKCVRGTFFIFVLVQAVLERFVIRIWDVQVNGTLVSVVGATVALWVMTFVVSMTVVWVVKRGIGAIKRKDEVVLNDCAK